METFKCMECRGMFDADDLIRYGDAYICGNCKPIFMQKLSEGALKTGKLRYAGFWRRWLAVALDRILLSIFLFIVLLIIFIPLSLTLARDGNDPQLGVGLTLLMYALVFLIEAGYETILIGKYGRTIGKMALQLEVVKADGSPVSYGLAFGRYFGKWLSYILFLVGYIIAAFDPEKRALHDRICNTRVVIK